METLTTDEAIAAGGVVGAIFGAWLTTILVIYILTIIAGWKIFKKAGEPGWKALIPIYNYYIMYKIVGMKGWFWGTFFITIIATIIMIASGVNFYDMTSEELASFNWGAYPQVIIALAVEGVISLMAWIIYAWRTSRAFGHGVGFAIGLFFLTNLFWLILGFGKSKYNKKIALK